MSNLTKFTPPHPLNTAVLFLVFNRLDTTKQVFEAIREAKPPRLYIAADGARESKNGEDEKVKEVREYILSHIDWDCEVKTLFREQNNGCKMAVSGAIDWFFKNEEMGIILEDDCLPSQSFFWFCEELLERYKDDQDIYLISGDGRATSQISIESDYGFIKYPLIWGWASWARTWKNYSPTLTDWPKEKTKIISNVSRYKGTRMYWENIFDRMYDNEIDTWDYQFAYLLLKNSGMCIVPRINLISNVGFGEDATHTFDVESSNANLPKYELNLPIQYHAKKTMNNELNDYYDLNEFYKKDIFTRIINKISRTILRKLLK